MAGGTNSHVILEKAPFFKKNVLDTPETQDPSVQSRKLFVLSANDKSALEQMMKNMGIYLEQRPEIFQSELMSNVAYTLGQRRSLMQWRIAISTPASFELVEALNSGKVVPTRQTEAPRIGFIFTGQGAQWSAMGRELYEHYPIFRTTMDACEACLVSFGAAFSLLGTSFILFEYVDSMLIFMQPSSEKIQRCLPSTRLTSVSLPVQQFNLRL